MNAGFQGPSHFWPRLTRIKLPQQRYQLRLALAQKKMSAAPNFIMLGIRTVEERDVALATSRVHVETALLAA
jgi:hypothetical protein